LKKIKSNWQNQFMEKAKEKGVTSICRLMRRGRPLCLNDANTKVVPIDEIPSDWEALDIGPKTSEKYREVVKKSKLVIWNGPMGVFEMDKFAEGTKAVAEALADADGYLHHYRRRRFSGSC
jgi:phosphoglycerate kinase